MAKLPFHKNHIPDLSKDNRSFCGVWFNSKVHKNWSKNEMCKNCLKTQNKRSVHKKWVKNEMAKIASKLKIKPS